jgi:uncharacterized phage protein (TIGR01671 family)
MIFAVVQKGKKMREILFRGKDIKGNWHIGLLAHIGNAWYISNKTGVATAFEVIPETVGQYTGLTDKNGKKIFEGDIVVCAQKINGNFIDEHIEVGCVKMKHGAFGLHRKQGYYRPFKDWLEDYEYEVIGNIHDNKELLDVK